MKVIQSPEKINPFGGINFVVNQLNKIGVGSLIDTELGPRVKSFGFQYSEIFYNHLSLFLTGGQCAEDINEHLRGHLQQVPGLNVCSADTLLRGIKEQATAVEELVSPSGVKHEFNINLKLNQLNIRMLKKTGQLNKKDGYTLDYDNQVIPTEKYDAKKTYKHCEGYQPGIASIGPLVVYVEGRNGNSQAKYNQQQTLARAFDLVGQHDITIERFRADSASYQKEVVDTVSKHSQWFYIRAMRSEAMEQRVSQIQEWKKVRLGAQEMEVASLDAYCAFGGPTPYRLVVSRIKRTDKQSDMFTGDAYTYRAILTNDKQWDAEKIVGFYNQRGSNERNFDMLNNDFGWSRLPCSFLNENTAFLILSAMYCNLYFYLIGYFSQRVTWLKESYRLKKFIFRFITVAAKWIKTSRQWKLKLYTTKDYSPVLT